MLNNLKIRTKLILLVSILIIFIGMLGWIGMGAFRVGDAALQTIYNDRVVPLRDLKIISDMYAVNIVDSAHKARSGSMPLDETLKNIKVAQETIHAKWKEYLATVLVKEEQQLVTELTPLMITADKSVDTLTSLLQSGKSDALAQYINHAMYPAIDPVTDRMSQLIEVQITVAKTTHDESSAKFESSSHTMLALIALALAIGAVLSYYIIRSISQPIAYVSGVITRMAAGDLSVDVQSNDSKDETGQMIRATAEISQTLKNVSKDLLDLIDAARAGSLTLRADPSQHKGEFANLIRGANEIIDTLAAPLHEVAAVMAKLASGDVKGRMMADYSGELRALKGNVNRSLDVLVTMLDAISAFAKSLADGNLTHAIEGSFQGDFASMKVNLNKAAEQLRMVLEEVRETTSQVSVSSQETTTAAVEVSRHASGQMTTLVDVSSAVEQTAAAISEIASSADRASVLARQAVSAAESGQATLTSLSTAVHGIAEKNAKITQISELISNIADKTYVLALNAGLEAARAGSEGSGFGLIAHKISTLAEEVAEATRGIRALVHEATESVSSGVATAGEAKTSMGKIVDMSQQSGHTIQSIAAAIEEQSAMAQLIKERVTHLQTVGQTTASAAEEISATMKSLSMMAQHLKAETDRIRTA